MRLLQRTTHKLTDDSNNSLPSKATADRQDNFNAGQERNKQNF